MHFNFSRRTIGALWIGFVAAAGAALPVRAALGSDLLGLYVGESEGESQVQATGAAFNGTGVEFNGQFRANDSSYKIMAGLRPISPLGVEVAFIDFGHPSGTIAARGYTTAADASMKGSAAFGVWYLPVPIVDVYVKVGLARLQSTVTS